jgi:hypothetical protein
MYGPFSAFSHLGLLSPFLRYNFKSDPRAVGAVVLLSADESTYNGSLSIVYVNTVKAELDLYLDNNATAQALQGTPHPTGEHAIFCSLISKV